MMKRIKQLIIMILCVLFSATLFAPYASAADTVSESLYPDYSRKGSVTLDILLSDGTKVPGGYLTAYLVAAAREVEGNNDFYYVKPFGSEDEKVDADVINHAEPGAPELAAELAKKAKDAEGVRVAVDENGKVVFSDLALGLYLIVQDTPAEGFEPIRSFLVTVPMRDGDDLIYDVVANPKVSVSYKQCIWELPVEKSIEIKSGTPDSSTKFSFRLTPKNNNYPMPDNTSASVDKKTGAMTISRVGAGSVSFGSFTFGLDDVGKTYIYTVEEIPGTNRYYSYDTRKYTVAVAVTMEKNVIQIRTNYVCSDNRTVDTIRFVNTYNNTPPTPSVPQTGQRWLPLYILGGVGLALFLLGWFLRRKKA